MNPTDNNAHATSDWKSDRLKDVVTLRNTKTDEISAAEDYLELEDMESGSGKIINKRNTLDVQSAVTLFKKGDVLFGKLRPYLEKYYQADFDGKCTGEILAFKPDHITSRFLFYSVGSHGFIERCNALAYGAKMPRVSWEKQLSQFDMPLPPRPEQERIAAFLDEKCAAIDAAVAAKRLQIATLEGMSSSIISDAVTRGLKTGVPLRTVNEEWVDKVPAHWDVCRIKRIVSRVDYGISESTERDGRFPVLKMGNIQSGEIFLKDIEYVESVEPDLLLEQGDVLYNRTNSPDQVAKAAVYRGSKTDGFTFASYLVRLRTNHRADPYYLTYLLNSSGFLTFARKMAIPSVQQSNLNSTRYCRMLIPLPPRKEQATIRSFLDEQTRTVRLAIANIDSQIATLTAYRKSLIHECVTGQRRV